jgi:hypothetical protein
MRRRRATAIGAGLAALALIAGIAYFVWGSWTLADQKSSVLQLFLGVGTALGPVVLFVAKRLGNSPPAAAEPVVAGSQLEVSRAPLAASFDTAKADVLVHPPRSRVEGQLRLGVPGSRGCLLQFAAALVMIAGATLAVHAVRKDDRDCCLVGHPPSTVAATPSELPTIAGAATTAVNDVLAESVSDRARLNAAIDDVTRCTNLSESVTQLRSVVSDRDSQIDTVQKLDISDLPGGAEVRSRLLEVLNAVRDADAAYLTWAEPTVTAGCGKTNARTAAFQLGETASTKAGTAKAAFLAIWNPIATAEHLPTRSANEI